MLLTELEWTAEWHVALVAMLSLFLILFNNRVSSPCAAIALRWARWLIMAYVGTVLLGLFGFDDRPFWVGFLVSFVIWFMIETMHNWLAIDLLSKSDLPLFPRYEENRSGDEWPNDARFIALREELRDSGFKRKAALVALADDTVLIRTSVYQNEAATVRAYVVFLPARKHRVVAFYSVMSTAETGERLITDNSFVPYGGFYPDSWFVERRPWTRSFSALLKRHQERTNARAWEFQPFEIDPLEDLNHQQGILERLNTDLGFLNPYDRRDEEGKITREGRYRVWKEVWMLSYLGLPHSY